MAVSKRDLLRGVAAAALAGLAPLRFAADAAAAVPPPKRLNLLFITADDMDWSAPGFMGGRPGLTPNLDRLAARSHVFANNRTVAPICMPSREAFMTGLLPHHSGGTGFVPVNEGTPSLTTVLQHAGYFTAAIHKVNHMLPQSSFPWSYVQKGQDRDALIHARGFDVALAEARAQFKPFFIECNINDPHRPFYGSREALKMDHGDEGAYAVPKPVGPADVVVPPMLEDLPPVREELAQYWNSVQRLDIAVGNILAALERSGEAGDTAVVFCSDHGMPFPFSKATCYDHGTRQPVLISWPGMGAPRRFENRTTSVDILPTLCELLRVQPPERRDGRSWMPIMRGESVPDPDFVVTYVNETASGVAYPARAIQDTRYSLVFEAWADGRTKLWLESMLGLTWPAMLKAGKTNPAIAARIEQYTRGVPLALYDLAKDPGQRRNLVHEPTQKARVARMTAALLQSMEQTQDPQLENFRTVLAGGVPVVKQDPERYRLKRGD